MLKGLRLRLAVLFTVFTGAVLAIALGISLYTAIARIDSDNEQWFASTIEGVAAQIQDLTTLAADEQPLIIDQEPYVISIRRDGEALAVQAGWNPKTDRGTLFEDIKDEALTLGYADSWVIESYTEANVPDIALNTDEAFVADDGTTKGSMIMGSTVSAVAEPIVGTDGIFRTSVDGVDYRATYFQWPVFDMESGESALYEVAILEALDAQKQSILATSLGYILLFALGLVVLFVANWLLARLVLRPTEEGVRRQSDFVAAASHELRSPLAVIRSSLSAADASPGEEEARRFRTAALDETERMSRLIDDLLLLAGGDADGWAVQKRPFDLDTLLIETSEVYTPLAREKGLGLRLALPDDTLPTALGDPDRLRQILAILLDNALQYAPAGSEVALEAEARRGKALLRVVDHGPGVPEGEKEKVFRRFYRADSSRQDRRHFGLGLSVARELSDLLGCHLALSDTEGGGATFTLTLPIQKPSAGPH